MANNALIVMDDANTDEAVTSANDTNTRLKESYHEE
jgi:hypothetical protein